ncbi:Pls/PosA family non-ribosomal peptide synthetase [Streptomyces catenulae]|uniref:Pls/PosA family non-ribosomal peptide synthetase n=1 Tax=Streptomyces catenulae TaxID=66875 RepID=A0ABV2YW76_9ACTN|nr:Pls/PosA family non-ribosomal peptide synthetase [Streptomyces catenulae]
MSVSTAHPTTTATGTPHGTEGPTPPYPGGGGPDGFFTRSCDRNPSHPAVECGAETLTYAELDRRANRLAHLLRSRGAGPGRRVGILLERSPDTYVTLLAVLKSGASYVPLDVSFPADRLAFIAADCGLHDLVTTASLDDRTRELPCRVLALDRATDALARAPETRPEDTGDPSGECYVIYTSGTTGRPKGVAVSRANIVAFLRAAAPLYGVTDHDRVHQGLSLAFDFALEEIWPAWMAGATLVAGPDEARRAGPELTAFLTERAITVLCCVPTLLTTLDPDLPALRTLLVSGEACPPGLVRSWSRPGRRILNAYGPTETTVTATCAELTPDRPVTIGTPLPGYLVYLLDEELRPVARGESGEICIGGPGVALGYVRRADLTEDRFRPNPVTRDRTTAPRIYRTGDRGRYAPSGEIEYLGRIDNQVKIRGYRIELGEIEEVLREDAAVENAVVVPRARDGTAQDLTGYVTRRPPVAAEDDDTLRERLHTALRRKLPGYMIPTFVEVLAAFPLLTADKVDRAALPPPTSPPLGRRARPPTAPRTPLERRMAALWQDVLGGGPVSTDDDFFTDLGGHSMTAARLISRLRCDTDLRHLAMGDLYAHPTVQDLAAYATATATAPEEEPAATGAPPPAPLRHSTLRVLACGVAQVAGLYLWLLLPALAALVALYRLGEIWHLPVHAPPAGSALATVAGLPLAALIPMEAGWLVLSLLVVPMVLSRVLTAGVRPGRYPLWGVVYLRFWLAHKLLVVSPLVLLSGSPLLPPLLRLLGARIGRHCHLTTVVAPPSLVTIGAGTTLGYGTRVEVHTVEGGWLRLAPVRIGAGCGVGTNSVVLPGAVLGDGATVGEQSLVPEDTEIPAGEHWAGSPATRQAAPPPLVADLGARPDDRRWPLPVVAGFALGAVFLLLLPLLIIECGAWLAIATAHSDGVVWGCLAAVGAAPLMVLTSCAAVLAVKRAVMPVARPGIHPERSAFGLRKWLGDGMMTMSLTFTQALYSTLYVIPFLRGLGARTGHRAEVATVTFVDPDMLRVGPESFLADVSVVGPAVFHHGHLALAPARVGRRSFVGNGALLPGSGRMGDNSLLGVHSVAPAEPIAPETTWLGSPAIFLPHREASPGFPERLTYAPSRGRVLARLAVEYVRVTLPPTLGLLSLLGAYYVSLALAAALPPVALFLVVPLVLMATGLAGALAAVAVKWLVVGGYRPRVEPLWSMWVRRTELVTGLYENLVVPTVMNFLLGTPWAPLLLRLFGARMGRRVWLSTTFLTEFDLVGVADDAAVGQFTSLQTHLFEDRVMKMSHVTVERGASVGIRSVVLYDSRVAEGASLDALSLVMKGEELPGATRWRGIPATLRPAARPADPPRNPRGARP